MDDSSGLYHLLTLIRLVLPKPVTTTYGHNIFLRYFESLCYDAKSLVVNDTPLSFGGYA